MEVLDQLKQNPQASLKTLVKKRASQGVSNLKEEARKKLITNMASGSGIRKKRKKRVMKKKTKQIGKGLTKRKTNRKKSLQNMLVGLVNRKALTKKKKTVKKVKKNSPDIFD